MEKCKFIVYLEEPEYVWLVLTMNAVCGITVLQCVLIIQRAFLLVTLLLICDGISLWCSTGALAPEFI